MPAINSAWPGRPTSMYPPLPMTIQPPPSRKMTADALSQAKRARNGEPGGLRRHKSTRLTADQTRHASTKTWYGASSGPAGWCRVP